MIFLTSDVALWEIGLMGSSTTSGASPPASSSCLAALADGSGSSDQCAFPSRVLSPELCHGTSGNAMEPQAVPGNPRMCHGALSCAMECSAVP